MTSGKYAIKLVRFESANDNNNNNKSNNTKDDDNNSCKHWKSETQIYSHKNENKTRHRKYAIKLNR